MGKLFEGNPNEESKEEKEFFDFRDRVFNTLQNREIPLHKRIENMLILANAKYEVKSGEGYYQLYMGLERLEKDWEEYLEKLNDFDFEDVKRLLDGEYQIIFEQLTCYFVFRHFADGFFADDLDKTAKFVAESMYVIAGICVGIEKENGKLEFSEIADICRRYSSEIEYSDENSEHIKQ